MRRYGLKLNCVALGLAALTVLGGAPWAAAEGTRARITESYYSAFCRDPTPDEYSFWLADPRSASLDAHVTAHRECL